MLNKVKALIPNLDPIINGNISYKMIISVRTLHNLIFQGTVVFGMVLYLQQMGISVSNIAIINTVYFLPQLFFRSFLGGLSDSLKNRRFFLYTAFFSSGVIYFFYPFIEGIGVFVLLRFLQGILEAGIVPITQTVVTENCSNKNRGGQVSLYKIVVYGGSMIGPVIIGSMIETTGFGFVFYISGLLMILAGLLSWFYINSFDLGNKREEIKKIKNRLTLKELKDHFFDGLIFTSNSNNNKVPKAFSWKKLKNDSASLFLLVTFIRRTAFNFFLPFLPLYLTSIIGLGEGASGMLEGVRRLMIVIAIILSGNLADILGRKPLIVFASFSFLGPLIYFLLPNLIGVWIVAVVLGLTIGCFNPTAMTYMADFSPPNREGTYLGAIGGVSSFSRLARIIGGITAEIIGLPLSYLVAGIIMAVTLPLSYLLEESLPEKK